MATHFYNGDFFGGEFFGREILVIDTHDGERRKRQYEEQRQAAARRREQLERAFDPRPAAAHGAVSFPEGSARPQIGRAEPAFDFDADDEEIILLI